MPLPSSTALTISTGCAGLTVEQALIAVSWLVTTGLVSACAVAKARAAEATTARAAPVIRVMRFMVVSYEHGAVAGLPSA